MANNVLARKVPYSIEAEQSVLGCILISDVVSNELCSTLHVEDFYSGVHQTIFAVMKDLLLRNQPVDYVTVVSELEKINKLNEIGGIDYITTLTNAVPTAANYKHYTEILLEHSKLRKLLDLGNTISAKTYDGESSKDIIEYIEKVLTDIAIEKRGGLEHIAESVEEVGKKFEEIAKNPNMVKGLRSGYYKLDKLFNGGFQKGGLFLLAARPGVGKTSLGMNMVTNAALESNAVAAVFSLEMTKVELAQRALCSVATVEMKKALNGELSADDWTALWASRKKLKDSNIYVSDISGVTVSYIISECRRIKREKGLDLVMIDYLQLMAAESGSKSQQNREQEVANITKSLKNAAKDLEVPILLLSQLSRGPEQRTDHRPMLADLRESGAIEQDADAVMFIYNPDKYTNDETKKLGLVELIVAKNRHGETQTVKLKFMNEYTTFESMNDDIEAASLEKNMPQFKKRPGKEDLKGEEIPSKIKPIGDAGIADDIF